MNTPVVKPNKPDTSNMPKYTSGSNEFQDGTFVVYIFETHDCGCISQIVKAVGNTEEKAWENAKTEFNTYLEREYRIGKTYINKLNEKLALAQMKNFED
jgi:hypothetical protein